MSTNRAPALPSPLEGEGGCARPQASADGWGDSASSTRPFIDTATYARELRWKMTEAEGKLWSKLRGRKLQGHRFRRQHPIGSYIADFICLEAKLIIELDGAQHAEELQAYKDRDRTIWLEKAGYRVLRFWNGDVSEYKDRAAVLDAIAYALSGAVPPSVCRGLMTAASTFPLKGGR